MFTRRDFIRSAALAPLAGTALSSPAFAQAADYPNQPIHAICLFPPGTGADVRVRFYAKKLQDITGKPVVVENKPGANGNIATEYVARSKPDGYTIFIAPGSSSLAAAPSLFKQLNYDPINDFEHITTLSTSAFVLVVDAGKPFKTLADLSAFIKEKGEKATYGSSANPGVAAGATYLNAFGLKAVEVKYKDSAQLYRDLAGGNLDFFFTDINGAGGHIKAGRVRPLAVSSAKRLSSWPDIPGAEEVGIKGLDIQTWWSVHTPAKTPKPILDKLEDWFNKIVQDPETDKFNALAGSDALPGNSRMLRELLVKETKDWARYAEIAKIEKQ